jgi:hypothetical protein
MQHNMTYLEHDPTVNELQPSRTDNAWQQCGQGRGLGCVLGRGRGRDSIGQGWAGLAGQEGGLGGRALSTGDPIEGHRRTRGRYPTL